MSPAFAMSLQFFPASFIFLPRVFSNISAIYSLTYYLLNSSREFISSHTLVNFPGLLLRLPHFLVVREDTSHVILLMYWCLLCGLMGGLSWNNVSCTLRWMYSVFGRVRTVMILCYQFFSFFLHLVLVYLLQILKLLSLKFHLAVDLYPLLLD